MAVFDTFRTNSGPTSLAGRIGGFAHSFMAKLIAWNDARVTRKSLRALTDRELSDIGLSRSAIDDIA